MIFMAMNLFPFETVRPEQDKLIKSCKAAFENEETLLAHAPTGLGKTVASLVPALEYALENDKIIFFVTGRHTQHKIALDTLRAIKDSHQIPVAVVNLIGKRHMCLQENITSLKSKDFSDYCRLLREDKKCVYFENLKKGEELSPETHEVRKKLTQRSPVDPNEMKNLCQEYLLCPYEIAVLQSRKAKVIVTDYQYLFNKDIRELFLKKLNKSLQDVIIIVDEAHNLPERVKDQGSDYLSTIAIARAISEADKYHQEELLEILQKLADFMKKTLGSVEEKYVSKELLLDFISDLGQDVESLIKWFDQVADTVREDQKSSYLGGIASFLKTWTDANEGYTRIIHKQRGKYQSTILSCRCLDPGIITKQVFEDAHSSILMSGTFTPTSMYANLLGISNPKELFLNSPFPKENRLSIIIPKTSTRFTSRSDQMWKNISDYIAKAADVIPGNVAAFFPSYYLLEQVKNYLQTTTKKTVIAEYSGMSRDDKHEMLERFKSYKETGALLLGVITGNFGEGIDLPGDQLKGVVVVGLPFQKPDLEAKALISYYDQKFGRGWDYGYNIPAFNKTLQSAGRCIRTGTDKGAIIFLDERYADPRYKRLFPEDWNPNITLLFEFQIKKFFGSKQDRVE